MSATVRTELAYAIGLAAVRCWDSTEDMDATAVGAEAWAGADAVLAYLGNLDGTVDAELIAWHLRNDRDEIAALRRELSNARESYFVLEQRLGMSASPASLPSPEESP